MDIFSENLKNLRKAQKVMQKDIAEYLGIAIRTYQSYEYGEREPDLKSLARLADYFDVSVDYLLGRTNNPGTG